MSSSNQFQNPSSPPSNISYSSHQLNNNAISSQQQGNVIYTHNYESNPSSVQITTPYQLSNNSYSPNQMFQQTQPVQQSQMTPIYPYPAYFCSYQNYVPFQVAQGYQMQMNQQGCPIPFATSYIHQPVYQPPVATPTLAQTFPVQNRNRQTNELTFIRQTTNADQEKDLINQIVKTSVKEEDRQPTEIAVSSTKSIQRNIVQPSKGVNNNFYQNLTEKVKDQKIAEIEINIKQQKTSIFTIKKSPPSLINSSKQNLVNYPLNQSEEPIPMKKLHTNQNEFIYNQTTNPNTIHRSKSRENKSASQMGCHQKERGIESKKGKGKRNKLQRRVDQRSIEDEQLIERDKGKEKHEWNQTRKGNNYVQCQQNTQKKEENNQQQQNIQRQKKLQKEKKQNNSSIEINKSTKNQPQNLKTQEIVLSNSDFLQLNPEPKHVHPLEEYSNAFNISNQHSVQPSQSSDSSRKESFSENKNNISINFDDIHSVDLQQPYIPLVKTLPRQLDQPHITTSNIESVNQQKVQQLGPQEQTTQLNIKHRRQITIQNNDFNQLENHSIFNEKSLTNQGEKLKQLRKTQNCQQNSTIASQISLIKQGDKQSPSHREDGEAEHEYLIRKGNCVKNIIKAFQNWVKEDVSNEVITRECPFIQNENLNPEEARKKLNRHLKSKSPNHSNLQRLFEHTKFKQIFLFFLSQPALIWIDNSSIKDKDQHKQFVKTLSEQYNNPTFLKHQVKILKRKRNLVTNKLLLLDKYYDQSL